MAFSNLHYFSKALSKQTEAYVILPEVGKPPYPTLYLLHGLSDNHTIWHRRTSIERYVENLPLIVVMPDGGRGFYTDAVEGFAYGTAIGTELVERIERTFPAKAERGGRALAGLSMGGYGSLRLALSHPDRFCAAVSHSGATGFGHNNRRDQSPEFARVLGPNYVGGPNDIWALAKNADPATLPTLRIDCGVDDFLIEENRDYTAYLTSIGVPHEYIEYPGVHDWAYWDEHIQDALPFLCDALGIAALPK